MATENIYAVCSAANWGDPDWAGKGSEVARDAYYDGTYTSLAAWEAGRNGDLTSGSTAETAEILGDDWSGSPDGKLDIGGWTCDRSSDEIVTIKTVDNGFSPSARNDYADGKWDATNYVISEEGSDESVDFASTSDRSDFDLDGLQIDMTGTGNENIMIRSVGANSDIRFYKCFVRSNATGSGDENLQVLSDADLTLYLINCIVQGINASRIHQVRVAGGDAGAVYIYNCTICGGNVGVYVDDNNILTAKNNATFDNTDDFNIGTSVLDYNASDDGDGDHSQTLNATDNYAAEFTDYANGDFRLKAGSVCVGNGVDDPSTGKYSDDITGTARSSTWDIGAFEYVAGGATLVISDLAHAHALDIPTLTQKHTISVGALDHSHTLDNVALTQKHSIVVSDLDHAHNLDAPILTQKHIIAIADLDHAQSLDNVTLTQAHLLALDALAHGHTLDTPTLTQAHLLSVADLAHAITLDNVTLIQAHVLTVDDLGHEQALDGVSLTQKHTLIISDLSHAHAIDNIVLAMAGTLIVQSLTHGHTLDTPTLVQAHKLAINGLTHSHSLDGVVLSTGTTLVVGGLTHAHSLDGTAIVQTHVLAVDSLGHVHEIGTVTLSGIALTEIQELISKGHLSQELVSAGLLSEELISKGHLSQELLSVMGDTE